MTLRQITVLILIMICSSFFSFTVYADETLQGIHVSGIGEISVEPDMASMTFQVSRQGRDAVNLKQEIDDVTDSVLKLTDSLSIPRRDVTAALVNIHPKSRYENNRHIMDGVNASRTISVVLKKLDHYGALINGVLALGINSVGSVQLESSKRVELEQQALKLAIADAKREAEAIAKHFDVRVLGVLDVHVGSHAVRPQVEARMLSASADSGQVLSTGELKIRRTIQATFSISSQ